MEIDKLIKKATIEKNGSAKEAYRAIKNELLLNESSKNPKPEGKEVFSLTFYMNVKETFDISISELDFQIISKLAKQREESASIYEANSRKDLADIEREQLKYLKQLLPEEISADRILEAIVTAYPYGYSQKEMGKVIKEIKAIFPTADGKLVSEVVKENIV